MSENYKFRDPDGIYFTTSTIVQWIDVFTKDIYSNMIIDSLKYCQKSKDLNVHAWCIMSNHIHLIVSKKGDYLLSEIFSSFKQYTSKEIVKSLHSGTDRRKEWILNIFQEEASRIKCVENYKLWIDGNHPVQLDTNKMIDDRLEYLHNNPVKAGIVYKPEDYVYSSAIDYTGGKGLIDIDFIV